MTGLYQPETIADALAALSDLGPAGKIMAGGTWVMRAPRRQEPMAQAYVAVTQIPELHRLDITDRHVTIGSGVTHAQLESGLQAVPELRGLVGAAGSSANPAVRRAASLGGNLCTVEFSAADLAPALLCQDALVDFETLEGCQRTSLEAFLTMRKALPPAYMLLSVEIPRRPVISAHARLPLRKAGDYPVAIVSAAVERRPDGTIGNAAVAISAVEAIARRWTALEEAIAGLPLDPALVHERAMGLTHDFVGREGPETPGWYRVQVLPALVRSVFEELQKS